MADDAVPPPATDQPALPPVARLRIAALWDRIRSGEDPLAFGAVIVVLALAAGLLWFWAGARHGGVPPAGAASDRSARAGGDGRARPPARTGDPAAGPEDRLPR